MNPLRPPTDKTGYTFHFEFPDQEMPINSTNLTVTKWAKSEQEAIDMLREDIGKMAVELEKRANNGAVPSPFMVDEK